MVAGGLTLKAVRLLLYKYRISEKFITMAATAPGLVTVTRPPRAVNDATRPPHHMNDTKSLFANPWPSFKYAFFHEMNSIYL